MPSNKSQISLSSEKLEKDEKAEFERLFKRASQLSFYIYGLTVVFFIFWCIGYSKEPLLVTNSSFVSKFFFFLNPHLLRQAFISGKGFGWLTSATNLASFQFLVSYVAAVICFVLIIFLSMRLFYISYITSLKPFHCISCLSVIPVVSCFLLTWFIIKLGTFCIDKKMQRRSRFEKDFEPEQFDDSGENLTPLYLASRPVTEKFNFDDYRRCFRKDSDRDYLSEIYSFVNRHLS